MSADGSMAAAGIYARATQEREWRVPVEMVLACSSSWLRKVVSDRAARNEWYKPSARVFARGNRFFAVVEFHAAKYAAVLLPLDVWLLENRP